MGTSSTASLTGSRSKEFDSTLHVTSTAAALNNASVLSRWASWAGLKPGPVSVFADNSALLSRSWARTGGAASVSSIVRHPDGRQSSIATADDDDDDGGGGRYVQHSDTFNVPSAVDVTTTGLAGGGGGLGVTLGDGVDEGERVGDVEAV